MRKFLYPLLITAAVLVGAAACDNSKISPAESVLLGCESFSSALVVVTQLNTEGKLTESTVELVDHARATVNPLCLGQAPDVNSTVKQVAVDSGTRVLLSIAAQFGRN